MNIGRATFYEQKTHFPDTYDKINEMLEDATLNNSNIETPVKVLYLKNKCGYMDKVETNNTNVNTNKNIELDHLTTEQIRELIKNEN